MNDKPERGLRIDRWLWYTRFFRTRADAAAAAGGGHVKINDERAKPGSRVSAGDRVLIVRDQSEYLVRVLSLPQRRGPSTEARQCYVEDENSRLRREARIESIRQDRRLMPRTEGRPDKRTRRRVRQFNRQPQDD